MHPLPPHLSATLVSQRRTSCPCGARTARPGALCRKCHHTALWLRHTRQAKHATRTARCIATHRAPVLLAVVAALIKGRR